MMLQMKQGYSDRRWEEIERLRMMRKTEQSDMVASEP
jgi:hypothetical protein